MPSYTSYLRQMAVLDADDNEIESWITVRGNHIPIKKGQSKEEAVKSFIEKKGGSGEKKSEQKSQTVQSALGAKWTGVKLGGKYHQFHKKEDAENFIKEAKAHGYKESDIQLLGFEEEKSESKKDTEKSYNDKGLYQDALNELDDQIADKEKELENIHLSMTENAEGGYFDIASANMEDIEFVKGQLEELKKKREKLAGSSKKD